MLIESALCLAQDGDLISVGGGSWTPESALGETLLARLTAHAGLDFDVLS
jgi:saccharopine dehydrogenase (NAD+, L-glutamate forming)